MQRLTCFTLATAFACVAAPDLADASLFCTVLKSRDGVVALRARPSATARIVARMRADEEVMLLQGRRGAWDEVMHWPSGDHSHIVNGPNTRTGWVRRRFISECG